MNKNYRSHSTLGFLYLIFLWLNIHSLNGLDGPVDLSASYSDLILSDCTVNFPLQDTEGASSFDIGKAYAWTVVDLLGFAGPIGTLSASSLHLVEALMLSSDSSANKYNEYIKNAFEQSWKCTKTYVDNVIQEYVIETSTRDAYKTISQLTDGLDSTINSFLGKTSDSEKRSAYQDVHGVSDKFHDLVNPVIFTPPFEPETLTGVTADTGAKCRLYMQHLTTIIPAMMLYYTQYLEVSGNKDTIISNFKWDFSFALQEFRDCAPFALYEVLTNSEERPLNYIKKELDIIYDGDLFCAWVRFGYETIFHSYMFGDDSFEDFTEWAGCGSHEWITYVNNKMLSGALPYQDINNNEMLSVRFDEYEMNVEDLWSTSQINDIIYSQYEYEISKNQACYNTRTCPRFRDSEKTYGQCSEPWGSEHFESDSEYTTFEWKYAIVQRWDDEDARFMFMGCNEGESSEKCGTIYSDTTNFYTKTHTCPFGSYITGGRYLAYDPLWDQQTLGIGGIQLICSNRNHYKNTVEYYSTGYPTSFQQLYDDYDDGYHWSPWYICPLGYKLDLKIIAMNECFDSYRTRSEGWGFWVDYYRNNEITAKMYDQKVLFKCIESDADLDTQLSGMIKSYSGLCLTITGNANGAAVKLLTCNENLETQQFYLTDNQLKNVNGKCVEVVELWDIGAPLQIMECDEGANQYWRTDYSWMPENSVRARILAKNSRCLTASGTTPQLSICEMDADTMWIEKPQRWSLYAN